MITKYFIDTNILWWYFTKNSKNHKTVKKYLDPIILNIDNTLYINEFVLIELLHLLIKRSEGGYSIGQKLLSEKYPFLKIIFDFTKLQSLRSLLEILNTHGHSTTIGGRDSSIITSMQLHHIENIISNDSGFKLIEDITVHDPI